MTKNEFIRTYAERYGMDYDYSKLWITTIFDCIYDLLIDPEVDELHLPYIGTIKHTLINARPNYDINSRKWVDLPARMNLTYVPTDKLIRIVRAMPPDPNLSKNAKKRRMDAITPHKLSQEELNRIKAKNEDNEDEVPEDE